MKSIRNKISFLADCARDVFSLFVALIFVVPIAGIASFAIGLGHLKLLIGFVLFTSFIAFSWLRYLEIKSKDCTPRKTTHE